MKKRLLITSIVMMLVVAVALSTATYAWFTSNASVTASSISMTAATNDAAALGISWTDGGYNSSITAFSPNDTTPTAPTFKPACPETLTVGTTLSTVGFNTAFATPSNGDMVFLANGAATDVYTYADDSTGTHSSFFVKNLSPANTIAHVTLTASISGTGSGLVRVGVFKKDGASYKLLGVIANQDSYTYTAVETSTTLSGAAGTYFKKYLGKFVAAVPGTEAEVTNGTADYVINVTTATANTFYTRTETASAAKATYGTITATNSVNAMATIDCVTSIEVATNLAAGANIELIVKVWEDAAALGDAEHGQVSTVALTFTAS